MNRMMITLVVSLLIMLQTGANAGVKYVPVDLAPYCTHPFADEKACDKKGGWTDQGPDNDLSMFPLGPQTFNGVPFNVVDPAKNNGKSCIVLNIEGFAPKSVTGIKIGLSDVKRIHFLHTSAFNPNSGDCGKYVVNYRYSGNDYKQRLEKVSMGLAPESSLTHPVDVPLISGQNITDWWGADTAVLPHARAAWGAGRADGGVGVLDFTWDNPDPTAYIESIDFCSPTTNTVVPILIAITLEVNDSPFLPSRAQKKAYYESTKLLEDSMSALNEYAESVKKQADTVLAGNLKTALQKLAAEVAASPKAQFGSRFKNTDSELIALRSAAESDAGVDFAAALRAAQTLRKSITDYIKIKEVENAALFSKQTSTNKAEASKTLAETKQILKGKVGYWARTATIFLNAAATYAAASANTPYKDYLNSQNAVYWANIAKTRAVAASNADTRIPPANAESAPVGGELPAGAVRTKVCLNGRWSISKGGSGDRFPGDGDAWAEIQVPHTTWTTGIDGQSDYTELSRYNGNAILWPQNQHFAWYRTTFDSPRLRAGQRVELEFKKVWHYAEVFVNGKFCGSHLGGWSRFRIDATAAVKPGRPNELEVYVEDNKLTERNDGANFIGVCCNGWRQQGGIYDDVFLHIIPSVAITDPFVQTSFRKKQVRVSFELNQGAKSLGDYRVSAVIRGESKFFMNLGQKTVKAGTGEISFTKSWLNPALWGPSKPWGNPGAMYRAEIRISDARGKLIDSLEVPFGFREFYIQGEKLYLNGKEIFLQGDHVDAVTNGGFSFRNPEFAVHFMNICRGANIDIIRTHCLEMPDWWYGIADQLGMMFEMHNHILAGYWESVPDRNWDDPVLWQYVSRDFRESTREYRNHPSIVLWSSSNEVLSAKQANWQDVVTFWQRMDKLIKNLDPTRPIHHQGNQGLTGYSRFPFDIACVHYGQDSDAKMHSKLFPGVPTIFGEFQDLDVMRRTWASPNQAALDAALQNDKDYLTEKIQLCKRNGIAGALPYMIMQWVALQALENRDRPAEFHKVNWPASSGIGVKTVVADAIFNWQRSDIPLAYRNSVYYGLRDLYDKRDPLKNTWPIQVIVDGAVPGQTVYARNNAFTGATQGIRADTTGRALFMLDDAGDYTFTAGGKSVSMGLAPVRYEEKGGFSHIPTICLVK